ncbi:MAG: carboxypeptidase-like regulatory domain-containing protein [Candidatus Eremiobacterota bacterium]
MKRLNFFAVFLMITGMMCIGCGDSENVIVTVTPTPAMSGISVNLSGTVTDNGIPLPYAYVRLYKITTQYSEFIAHQISGADGKYIFTSLPSGTYRIETWLSKNLYDSGQSSTGANNINTPSPGTYTSDIINGNIAPVPTFVPTSTPVPQYTSVPSVTPTPTGTSTPSSGVWNPVIQ